MSNLLQRLLTALVAIPIVLSLIYLAPSSVWVIFVSLVAAICAHEFYGIVAKDSKRLSWLGPLASFFFTALLGLFLEDRLAILTIVSVIPILALLTFLFHPTDLEKIPARAGAFSLGLLYTGLLPALIAHLHFYPRFGPDLIILSLTIAFLGDTGAYASGRIFGRHPLSKIVSPKKTIEGSIGGLICSSAAVAIAHFWYLPELSLSYGLILGAILGGIGQLGDLCESLLKRACDVKDSGKLLPGHGGMLDRIDALLFVVVGLYLALHWLPILP